MFLLVPDHPGNHGQNPESHKTVVVVTEVTSRHVKLSFSPKEQVNKIWWEVQTDRPAGEWIPEDGDLFWHFQVKVGKVVGDRLHDWTIRECSAVGRHTCTTVEVNDLLPTIKSSLSRNVSTLNIMFTTYQLLVAMYNDAMVRARVGLGGCSSALVQAFKCSKFNNNKANKSSPKSSSLPPHRRMHCPIVRVSCSLHNA